MSPYAVAIKLAVISLVGASALYVHRRGRIRHRFTRQLTDHSTFLAGYNALIYLNSAVPEKPYLYMEPFPDAVKLRENWQVIRDEAVALFKGGHIRAAAKY